MTEQLIESVRSKYEAVAESTRSSNDAGVKAVAEAFGYSADELTAIPAEANMGLSCGNPTAIASIRPREVIVDLGSGGGMDVFRASLLVGPEGKVIGIDMTPDRTREGKREERRIPKCRIPSCDYRPSSHRRCFSRLRHQQLRHQSRS